MPVVQAEDGMEIHPDCVYVIQPGKNMRLSDGKLVLGAQRPKELNLPIDIFFRSLAEEAGARLQLSFPERGRMAATELRISKSRMV